MKNDIKAKEWCSQIVNAHFEEIKMKLSFIEVNTTTWFKSTKIDMTGWELRTVQKTEIWLYEWVVYAQTRSSSRE